MIDDAKIEEIRKKIKKTIEREKMYIENEPEISGHPDNTIATDKDKGDLKDEQRHPKQK